jgi:hypothetical protein
MRAFAIALFTFGSLRLAGAVEINANPKGLNYEPYGVVQDRQLLILKTPMGTNVYLADHGFHDARNFAIEIPLSELRTKLASIHQGGGSQGPTGTDPNGAIPPKDYLDVSSLAVEANRLYSVGQFKASLGFVEEILKREPNSLRGWSMRGSLMHVLGHADIAKASWKKALQLDPKNENLRKLVGESL